MDETRIARSTSLWIPRLHELRAHGFRQAGLLAVSAVPRLVRALFPIPFRDSSGRRPVVLAPLLGSDRAYFSELGRRRLNGQSRPWQGNSTRSRASTCRHKRRKSAKRRLPRCVSRDDAASHQASARRNRNSQGRAQDRLAPVREAHCSSISSSTAWRISPTAPACARDGAFEDCPLEVCRALH